ncbi:serine hydrolase [Candidatus Saganbacteria bacterium]|nr:serine hydrolase [Candidatus Saganbacteria bacterium]
MRKFFSIILLALAVMDPLKLEAGLRQIVDRYGERVGLTYVDVKSGRAVSINGDLAFPAASVIKLPIMAATFKEAEEHKISLEDRLAMTEEKKLPGSGVLQWLKPNTYTIWNLTRMMISLSDNTATRLISDKLGLEKINAYCQTVNLKQTVVKDGTALVEPPSAEANYTSPRDMANLLMKIYSRDGFTEQSVKDMLAFMENQRYRWGICRPLPWRTKIANKTGNYDGVLNDVGIVFTPAGDYVLSIFTNGFPKKREAREIINAISAYVYEAYQPGKIVKSRRAKPKKRSSRKARKVRVRYPRRSPRS